MVQLDQQRTRGGVGSERGVVRRVDVLGRVVVPAEMRRVLGMRHGDLIETRLEHGRVVMAKIERECTLCGGADGGLVEIHDKRVCNGCVSRLVDRTQRAAPALRDPA